MIARSLRLLSFQVLLILFCSVGVCSSALADAQSPQTIRLQQEALLWTRDYEGLVDGKSGSGTVSAIRNYQLRKGDPVTGTLTENEVKELYAEGFGKRDSVAFRQVADKYAGISVGLPTKLFADSSSSKKSWGTSWYSKKNGIAIDTLRFTKDTGLRELYDKLLTINNRKVTYSRYVDDRWFVISALEGEAAVYIRADFVHVSEKPDEIRGFSIWMSEHRPPEYQSIAPAMLSSFRSDTDMSHDVSVPQGGPPIPPRGEDPSHIDTTSKRNPPPPATIVTSENNKPPSTGDCFYGLGNCPLTAFALKP